MRDYSPLIQPQRERCSAFYNIYFLHLQWVPEITHYCPKTPFLLVGMETDLRDDPETVKTLRYAQQAPITVTEAEKFALEIKAVKYVECSARTQQGLANVFEEATLAALASKSSGRKRGFTMPKVSLPNLFKGELYTYVGLETMC